MAPHVLTIARRRRGVAPERAKRLPLAVTSLAEGGGNLVARGHPLYSLEDIDRLLVVEKWVAGQASWSRSRETTLRISVPLQIDGTIVGSLFLSGTASIYNRPQDGSLLLLFQKQVIERMNVFPTSPHANPLDRRLPRSLRGVTLPALQHRYHAWALNAGDRDRPVITCLWRRPLTWTSKILPRCSSSSCGVYMSSATFRRRDTSRG